MNVNIERILAYSKKELDATIKETEALSQALESNNFVDTADYLALKAQRKVYASLIRKANINLKEDTKNLLNNLI